MLKIRIALAGLLAGLPLLLGGAFSSTAARPSHDQGRIGAAAGAPALGASLTDTAAIRARPTAASSQRVKDCAPSLRRLHLAVATVSAGGAVQGRITLRCRVKRTAVVRLTATNGLSVPVSVNVARGDRAATFSVLAQTESPRASVSARLRGSSRSDSLSVTAQQSPVATTPTPDVDTPGGSPCSTVSDLVVPTTLYAGDESSSTIALSCPATTDTTVTLTSSSPDTVVPTTVVVPVGASTIAFPVRPQLVSGPAYTTQITARSGSATLTRGLTVAPGLVAIELPVTGLSGPTSYVKVVLSGPPSTTEYVDVPITSSNSARGTWPATLSPRSSFASAGVYRTRVLTRDEPITLSATLGTRTVSVTSVLRAPGVASTVTIVRISQADDEVDLPLHGLDSRAEYMAILDRPAPPVTTLDWAAPNDGPGTYLTLATSTSVLEGEVVSYNGFDPPDVDQSVHFDLRAALTGHSQVVGSLPVSVHPTVRSVSIPPRIVSGSSFQAVIALAGPSEVDTEVAISPLNGALSVQPTVTIPAGATQAPMTVTSIPVAVTENMGLLVHVNQSSGRHTVRADMVVLAAP